MLQKKIGWMMWDANHGVVGRVFPECSFQRLLPNYNIGCKLSHVHSCCLLTEISRFLDQNDLTGPIPSEIGFMKRLRGL